MQMLGGTLVLPLNFVRAEYGDPLTFNDLVVPVGLVAVDAERAAGVRGTHKSLMEE